jgi:hypothetical protein
MAGITRPQANNFKCELNIHHQNNDQNPAVSAKLNEIVSVLNNVCGRLAFVENSMKILNHKVAILDQKVTLLEGGLQITNFRLGQIKSSLSTEKQNVAFPGNP